MPDISTSHGTQGIMNTASKSTLENEFGTSNEDEVIKQILQKGDVQTTQVRHDITEA
jgi:ribosome maturation protein Sdo1